MPAQKVSDDRFIVSAHKSGNRISDGSRLPSGKIDAQLVSEHDKIATSVTISFGEPGYELSYAGSGLSHDHVAFTDPEAGLFIKGLFE
jgi:hypothetical protein